MMDFLTDAENFWIVMDRGSYEGMGRIVSVGISQSSGVADLSFSNGASQKTKPVAPSILDDARDSRRASVIEMTGHKVSDTYPIRLSMTA